MKLKITISTKDSFEWCMPSAMVIVLSPVCPDGISAELDFNAVLKLLFKHPHEWSLVYIVKDNDVATAVHLVKSITSSHELFYTVVEDDLVVGDQFVSCVAHLPKESRVPSQETVIDHFLFRAVSGANTYLKQVSRVPHGVSAYFAKHSRLPVFKRVQRLESNPQKGTYSDYLSRVDHALMSALAPCQDDILMFSGGIDSTLLAHYMPQAKLIFNKISSPEFAPDASYAYTSANLLKRNLQTIDFDESQYLTRLEDVIDRLGMPPQHAQTVLHSEAFVRCDAADYAVGEFADSNFGFCSARKCKYGPLLAQSPLFNFLEIISRSNLGRTRRIYSVASQFRCEPRNAGSFANSFARWLKLDIASQIFSQDAIESRCEERVDYVTQLFEPAQSRLASVPQRELGHLVGFYTADTLSVWRQLAQSYGKTCHAPFASPIVVSAAMSIPASQRYSRHGETKYLLKDLVRRFVPEFPSSRPKLGAAMPILRMVQEGCLHDFFDKYTLPSFISKNILHDVILTDYAATWHLISFMVWSNRVKRIDKIPPSSIELSIMF